MFNLTLEEYIFRIKKDVLCCWASTVTSSFMRGAKCYGNIYLFIYLFI